MKFAAGFVVVGLLLFLPAGSIDWWQGWLFMAILFIPMFIAGLVMMVKAPELTHEALISALERGDCYSSDGPEIYDLYVEDGKVHIRCSDAVGIFYTSAGRKKNCKLAPDYDHPINEAVFPLPEDDICFRLSVKDIHGKHANTRYFFINDLKA
jgi:hypothetical protein